MFSHLLWAQTVDGQVVVRLTQFLIRDILIVLRLWRDIIPRVKRGRLVLAE